MPKIFLIKNRLHQQQLRLLESQNLLGAKEEDRLGPLVSPRHNSGSSPPPPSRHTQQLNHLNHNQYPHHQHHQNLNDHSQADDEPLSLVSRKKDNRNDSGELDFEH